MKSSNTKLVIVLAIFVVLAGTTLGGLTYIRKPRLTPARRGAQLAEELGCFACHGPGGTGGIPNPGSEEEEVPAWDGGTAMMYVKNEQEIREWILYGRPKRLEDEHSHEAAGDPEAHGEDSHVQDTPPPQAQEGYRVASRLGCFGCHGPGGRVGSKNPGSFKEYIPPWHGGDFAELVKSDNELREWILDGAIDRFESNPIARYFTRRQVIKMPAYKDALSDGELHALVAYIHWLQEKDG
jgi:mono/diheme cytochrome c family protein